MKHKPILLILLTIVAVILPIGLAISNVQAATQNGRLDFGSEPSSLYKTRYRPGDTFIVYMYEVSSLRDDECTRGTVFFTPSVLQPMFPSSLEGVFGIDKERIFINSTPAQGVSFAGSCPGDKRVTRSGRQQIARIGFKVIGEGPATIWYSSDSVANGDTTPTRGTIQTSAYPDNCPSGYTGTPPNCKKIPPPPPPTAPTPPPPTPTPTPKPAPTPTPKPAPKPAPKPSPTPSPTPAPQPPRWENVAPAPPQLRNDKDNKKSKPKISKPTIKGDDIRSVRVTPTINSAVVVFQYNGSKSDMVFAYHAEGEGGQRLLAKETSAGFYRAALPQLQPLTKYYFSITGSNDSMYADSFYTLGYPVSIHVLDQGTPLTAGEVVIENGGEPYTYQLDEEGVASIFARPGELTVSLSDNSQHSQTFAVEELDTSDPDEQVFQFDVTASQMASGSSGGNGGMIALVIMAGALLVGLASAGVFFFLKKRQQQPKEVELPPDYMFPWEQTATVPPVSPDGQPVSPAQALPSENTAPYTAPPPPQPPSPTIVDGEEVLDLFEEANREGRFKNL